MNVTKLFIYLFIVPFLGFSQTKNDDAYYILDVNNLRYVITSRSGKEVKNVVDKERMGYFKFYKRDEYEKRKQQIKKDKEEGKFIWYQDYQIIETLSFDKRSNSKVTHINHCDTHFLNLVNYDWLVQNSWKQNNPNILFKNLYFLLKLEKDKYLKFKVNRTLIAR